MSESIFMKVLKKADFQKKIKAAFLKLIIRFFFFLKKKQSKSKIKRKIRERRNRK